MRAGQETQYTQYISANKAPVESK